MRYLKKLRAISSNSKQRSNLVTSVSRYFLIQKIFDLHSHSRPCEQTYSIQSIREQMSVWQVIFAMASCIDVGGKGSK